MKSMMPVIAVFIGLLALMTFFFDGVIKRRHEPNRTLVVGTDGPARVSLTRNVAGRYVAPGRINEVSVNLLVDTGADSVAVPEHIARRANLTRGARVMVATAGGRSSGYQTRIDQVTLGGIQMRNVPALVVPDMGGDAVLLGMSFLRHVDFSQQGDELIIERRK
ncbi:MAG: retropepsin-like aspartic protease family protein [Panacagrimonas sp.]